MAYVHQFNQRQYAPVQTYVPVHQELEVKKPVLASTYEQTCTVLDKYKEKAVELKKKTVTIVKDPQFQTFTIATATGTVVVGAIGGAFGMATGVVTGSVCGVPPAIFTFGLSIPAGAMVGGTAGSGLGVAAGAGVGCAAGYGTYKYRVEIKDGLVYVKVKAVDTAKKGKVKAMKALDDAKLKVNSALDKTKAEASKVTIYAKSKASEASDYVKFQAGVASDYAKDKTHQVVKIATTTKTGVTATSAAAGGVVGATSGGAMGVIGGAALGVVPALFTFGLSIPVGATCGLFIGAGVGGATGATGGAAAGYGAFTYRKELGSGAQMAWDKATTSAENIKTKAMESATHVKESVKSLVGGGTGGTA